MWRDISTAPKSRASRSARVSKMLWLLIPYDKPQADIGHWDFYAKCWRFMGDDGPQDIQPTHWSELFYPDIPAADLISTGPGYDYPDDAESTNRYGDHGDP